MSRTIRTPASRVPSGDHIGGGAQPSTNGSSRRSFVPSASTTQVRAVHGRSSKYSEGSTWRWKAIRFPSGDHAGLNAVSATTRGSDPSGFTTTMSPVPETTASSVPPGDHRDPQGCWRDQCRQGQGSDVPGARLASASPVLHRRRTGRRCRSRPCPRRRSASRRATSRHERPSRPGASSLVAGDDPSVGTMKRSKSTVAHRAGREDETRSVRRPRQAASRAVRPRSQGSWPVSSVAAARVHDDDGIVPALPYAVGDARAIRRPVGVRSIPGPLVSWRTSVPSARAMIDVAVGRHRRSS